MYSIDLEKAYNWVPRKVLTMGAIEKEFHFEISILLKTFTMD